MNVDSSAPAPATVVAIGTFDLFHGGHLAFLKRASELGERLVVGIRSDALANRRSGAFPYFVQRERLAIVRDLKCVSECFLVEEDGQEQGYIDSFGAQVFAAGEDKRGQLQHLTVPRIDYLPRTPSIETSALVGRIRDQPFTVRDGLRYRIGCTEHAIEGKTIVVEGEPDADTIESRRESELLRIVACLAKIHEVFTKHGIEYCMIAGTLLGAARHAGIIPWDDDGDLLVDKRAYMQIEGNLAEIRRDFHPYEIVGGTAGYKVGVGDLFPVDVMVFDSEPGAPDMLVPAGPVLDGESTFEMKLMLPHSHYRRADIFPLRLYPFEHIELYGPANAEALLYAEYNERALDELLYSPALVRYHQMFAGKGIKYDLIITNAIRRYLPAPVSRAFFRAFYGVVRRTFYRSFNK